MIFFINKNHSINEIIYKIKFIKLKKKNKKEHNYI